MVCAIESVLSSKRCDPNLTREKAQSDAQTWNRTRVTWCKVECACLQATASSNRLVLFLWGHKESTGRQKGQGLTV